MIKVSRSNTSPHQPGCAVIHTEEEKNAQSRYNSYLNMLEDKDEGKNCAAY